MKYNNYLTRRYNEQGHFSVLINNVAQFEIISKFSRWNKDVLEFWYEIEINRIKINYLVNTTGFVFIGNSKSKKIGPSKYRINIETLKEKINASKK